MRIDPADVARRIKQARKDKELHNYAALAEALQRRSGSKKPTPETVRLWETGNHIPPYDMVELLSLELDQPGEWILFGITRDLKQERYVMERVSDDELRLLNYFRRTATDYRADVLDQAELAAKRHPAPLAIVQPLTRKR